MKKLAIAGASAVLAALPVVGAFAVTGYNEFTDTLTVNVTGGCTLENSTQSEAGDYSVSDRSFTKTIAAGTVDYLNATDASTPSTSAGEVSIECNTDQSTDTYTVTVTVDGLTDSSISETIAGGAYTSGATSGWAIKSNATGVTGAANPFASYTAAPTAAQDGSATFLTSNASATVTFNPTYQVYIAPDQDPGTYVGHAIYHIAMD